MRFGAARMINRIDPFVVCSTFLLIALGLVAIVSATIYRADEVLNPYVVRHAIYMLLAVVVFFTLLHIPLALFHKFHKILFLGTLVISVLVLIPWIGVVAGGGRRWIDLGLMTVQVTEVARFLVPVYVAGHLANTYSAIRVSTSATLRPIFWVGILLVLFILQPDFGSAVLIGGVTVGMLYVAGARFRDLILLGIVGAGGLAYVFYHRWDRITAFLDTWTHSSGEGYQLAQSLIGFGRGELTGVGFGDSVQKFLYLPESHNDFIFSVIVEETGFLGGALLLLLLVALVCRCWQIGKQALEQNRYFAGYIAFGAGLMLGFQTLINVGVTMGALPTKGLTLPFISFGGNSLLVCVALVALVCRARAETLHPKLRRDDLV
ncbi:MAG: cell division protein FtsW [Gammaproteobacteria bacterium]|nr:cell division protein FtsW [Gammaproteobacteria bacterium]MYC25146.1 cell division protein FtsW [Gammaproteobacteria bacterium]